MKPSETLRAAKAVIEDPAAWTKKDYAKSVNGWKTVPTGPFAVKWCSVGALAKAMDDRPVVAEESFALHYINRAVADLGVICFNDTSTHAEVMDMFDRAIALAEVEGQ